MTEFGDGSADDKLLRETVTERVVETTCPACGVTVVPTEGPGRPARYCSAACRQKAWALRTAERALGTKADRRPTVIRDVVDRHTERVIERKAPVTDWAVAVRSSSTSSAPTDARGWVTLLTELAGQLADSNSVVAAQHFNHARIAQALQRAWDALDAAHPGGLGHAR
jgi:hypothetical protein